MKMWKRVRLLLMKNLWRFSSRMKINKWRNNTKVFNKAGSS